MVTKISSDSYNHVTIQLGQPDTIKRKETAIDEGYEKVTDADGSLMMRKLKEQ